jgi:hypothetical protein
MAAQLPNMYSHGVSMQACYKYSHCRTASHLGACGSKPRPFVPAALSPSTCQVSSLFLLLSCFMPAPYCMLSKPLAHQAGTLPSLHLAPPGILPGAIQLHGGVLGCVVGGPGEVGAHPRPLGLPVRLIAPRALVVPAHHIKWTMWW